MKLVLEEASKAKKRVLQIERLAGIKKNYTYLSSITITLSGPLDITSQILALPSLTTYLDG